MEERMSKFMKKKKSFIHICKAEIYGTILAVKDERESGRSGNVYISYNIYMYLFRS